MYKPVAQIEITIHKNYRFQGLFGYKFKTRAIWHIFLFWFLIFWTCRTLCVFA